MNKKSLGTALITGGAKRVGSWIATYLAQIGYDIIINYNNSNREAKILQKLYKQRMESAEIFKQQGRKDLEDPEMFQADIIKAYLPAQMSEDEIRKIIAEAKAQTGASGPADMGKLMGAIMPKLQGKADGKVISTLVKEALS